MIEESENFFHNKYGYCYYSLPSNKRAMIYNLYVEPEYRRKGHARELLQFVISEIRKTGYKGIIDIEACPREDSIGYKELSSFYLNMGLNIL
jgi:ribosomal protein S18 acetylase RimI-like enzyme